MVDKPYLLKHEPRKREVPIFTCKLLDNTTHIKSLITGAGLASSAKVTFIPVLHEKRPDPSRDFYIEIGSNAHEQCVTRCPVSRLVHSPGRPVRVITGKISTRDPGITILGCQPTGLARFGWKDFRSGLAIVALKKKKTFSDSLTV